MLKMTSSLRAAVKNTPRASLVGLGLVVGLTTLSAGAGAQETRDLSAKAQALQDEIKLNIRRNFGHTERKTAAAIRKFYDERNYQYVWFRDGRPTRKVATLLKRLDRVDLHGLDAAHYGMPGLTVAVQKITSATIPAMEIRLTRVLIDYAGDLSGGSVKPWKVARGIYRRPKRPDPMTLMTRAADSDDFDAFLKSYEPRNRRYRYLMLGLRKYRAIAANGGWGKISTGGKLKKGMKNRRVAQARRRLMITGDIRTMGADPELFDGAMVEAVRRFQRRQGLWVAGFIGPETLRAMNVPVKHRINQILINMERRRWMPKALGKRYVWVNISDFYMKLVENDKTIHVAKIVVGKTYHKTPIFSGTMKYIIFNPYWNVPYSIATKEMLPKLKKNPGYLDRGNYLLLTRSGDNSSAISPRSVDWSQYSTKNFPYFIRQKPGRGNALGNMVFMFPNRFNVFLHDTSSRHLFDRYRTRTFSHGCMRVQNPARFAALLLNDKSGWSPARIRRVTNPTGERKQSYVRLQTPIPVHITYLTAFATKAGEVNFRNDVYRRDAQLIRVLNRTLRRQG